jgi:ATP-dependent Clp protease ATP-binding subunit ClpB
MNLNRYTEKAQEAILGAQQLAERSGHPDVIPEHLLQTLITQPDGIATAVLSKMQVDVPALRAASQELLDKLPSVQGGATPGLNARLRTVFQAARR